MKAASNPIETQRTDDDLVEVGEVRLEQPVLVLLCLTLRMIS